MINFIRSTAVPALVLAVSSFLSFSPAAADEVYPFRVVYEETSGTEHLVNGDLAKGIQILEQALESGASNEGYVLATLCGAYVLTQNFVDAEKTCNEAVNRYPGDTAYNNRGVLRAFRGDIDGAQRDLDRARPPSMDDYLAILKETDIGLVSNQNHDLIQRLSANQSGDPIQPSYAAVKGADIETLTD